MNLTASKNFVCQPAFALWGNWGSQRTLHTFANRASQPITQNLQRSAILHPPKQHLFYWAKTAKKLEIKRLFCNCE